MGNTNIRISDDVFNILEKTARRSGISIHILGDCCVAAFETSIKKHVPKSVEAQGAFGTRVSKGDHQISLNDKMRSTLHDYSYTLGVHPSDLFRDCVFAMKSNLTRIHPVNARHMSSIRMTLFHREQQGIEHAA